MIEQVYHFSPGDAKTIERLVTDENIHYAHIILPPGEGTPQHMSNANVYLTVLRGELTLRLGQQEAAAYAAGSLLKIPEGIEMDIHNQGDVTLELTIVKAPPPLA
jgi:quercetin dioxygenase-like cupin family protein